MIIFTTYFTTFAFILTPIKRFLNWLFIGNYNTFLIAGQYNGGVVLSEILNWFVQRIVELDAVNLCV